MIGGYIAKMNRLSFFKRIGLMFGSIPVIAKSFKDRPPKKHDNYVNDKDYIQVPFHMPNNVKNYHENISDILVYDRILTKKQMKAFNNRRGTDRIYLDKRWKKVK